MTATNPTKTIKNRKDSKDKLDGPTNPVKEWCYSDLAVSDLPCCLHCALCDAFDCMLCILRYSGVLCCALLCAVLLCSAVCWAVLCCALWCSRPPTLFNTFCKQFKTAFQYFGNPFGEPIVEDRPLDPLPFGLPFPSNFQSPF